MCVQVMRKGRDYCEVVSADPFDGEIIEDCSDSEFDVEHPDNSEAVRLERENMLELYSGDHQQLKLAYEDWGRSHSLLGRRVEHGTALASFVRKEICHLLGVFVVVEGVLLVTVAQTNLLTCESWWVFFYLSFLASVVLLIPLTQRITVYWSLRSRISNLLSGLELPLKFAHTSPFFLVDVGVDINSNSLHFADLKIFEALVFRMVC